METLTVIEELEKFNNAFSDFIDDVTTLEEDPDIVSGEKEEVSIGLEWLRKAMDYNLPGGKKFRALLIILTHKLICEHRKQAPNFRLARTLGWCIELLQSGALIFDDIMDESDTRRGKTCWHLCEDVGMKAINDAFFMTSSTFNVLHKHSQAINEIANYENNNENINDNFYYVAILELVDETIHKTTIGQCLDIISTAKQGQIKNFYKFTEEKYNTLVYHKTSFYSFVGPIRLGMLLSGVRDTETHRKVTEIMRRMGQLFQVQDDYLDCYGDPETTGKIGTDIEDGKCCWPIVTALKLANQEQKDILFQNYGRKDKEHVEAVKSIYNQLNIDKIYARYEKRAYQELLNMIEQFSIKTEFPSQIFYWILEKLLGRKK